jgi:hypothetical protein
LEFVARYGRHAGVLLTATRPTSPPPEATSRAGRRSTAMTCPTRPPTPNSPMP